MGFQTRSLVQQGYSHLTAAEISSIQWGLRFTPTVCMLAAIYGLSTHNAPLLAALAVLGIAPFWFPAWHPVDRLYNHVVAPLVGATRLPPNPFPRRIACVSAGVMNTAAAIALSQGAVTTAYAFGGLLFVLQLIVNTTHFCVASFLIELALKAMGLSLPTELVAPETAQRLVGAGALLVDVRDEAEFAMERIPEAVNIPLGRIKAEVARLREANRPIIVYCRSGARSRMALGLLAQGGLCGLHNLGRIDRWPSWRPAPAESGAAG